MNFLQKIFITILAIFATQKMSFTYGQSKIHLGVNTEIGAKLYPIKYYNVFASIQPSVLMRIEDEQYNRIGLILSLGLHIDQARYKLVKESTPASKAYIDMTHHNLSFTGLVTFPTRNESLKILAGIGAEYALETDVAYAWTGGNSIGFIQDSPELDSLQKKVDANLNKILPAVCLGIQYHFPRAPRVKFYCLYRQNLLNSFTENIPVYTIITGKNDQAPTNYRPSYLKLGLSYDFW